MGDELLSNANEAPNEAPPSSLFPPRLAEEMPDDDEPERMPLDDDPWSDEDWDDEEADEDDDALDDEDDADDWEDDWDDDDEGVEARRRDQRSSAPRPKHHRRHGSDRRHSQGTRRVID